MGSQTMGDWVDLGTYTAMPGNGEQAFDLLEPSWARYLKFRFLSHYGAEHYCTFSQIKVHGSTMLQGFHEQWDSQEDLQDEEEGESAVADGGDTSEEEMAGDADTGSTPDGAGAQGDESAVDVPENNSEAIEPLPATVNEEGAEGVLSTESVIEKGVEATKEMPANGGTSSDSVEDASVAQKNASDEPTDTELPDTRAAKEAVSVEESSASDQASTQVEPKKAQSNSDEQVGPSSSQNTGPALSSASIGVSSHKAVDSGRIGSTEELSTNAIAASVEKDVTAVVASAVKAVVAEASEAIMAVKEAPTVSVAVKELQQKLKTTIAIGSFVQEQKTEKAEETSVPDLPIKIPDITADAAAGVQSSSEIAEEADKSGSATAEKESAVAEAVDTSDGKASENNVGKVKSSEESVMPKEEVVATSSQGSKEEDDHPKSQTAEETEFNGKDTPVQLDSSLARSIVERFPSAGCMVGLNYQDFKAKIIAARKGGANSGGSHPSGNVGKMEPIFKTLTDEIKTLQVSQSVQDQYVKALVTCYQQVIFEIAQELNELDTLHEKRLSDLEEAMDAMRSSGWTRIVVPVATGILSLCVLGASAIFRAFSWVLTEKKLQEMTTAGISISGAGIVLLGAFALFVLTVSLFVTAPKRKRIKNAPTNKKAVNGGPKEKLVMKVENNTTPGRLAKGPSGLSTKADEKVGAANHKTQPVNGAKVHHPLPLPTLSIRPGTVEIRPNITTEPDLIPVE